MLPIPLLLCFSLFLQTTQSENTANNVCRSISDYRALSSSKDCFYNPNVGSTMVDMVVRNGYPFERHEVVTQDGYILSIYRIFKKGRSKKSQPVILQHGIGASAAFYVLRGKDSLAFYLYDRGYDVWIPNIRGATDSTRHVKLSDKDKAFWDFEFEDIALKDLPAIIDKIGVVTGQKGNIIYMGHSMGTTVSYVYCSLMKSHCVENLRGLVSISPVAYLRNISPPLRIASCSSRILIFTLKMLGVYEIGNNADFRALVVDLCSHYPTIKICAILNVLGTGLSLEEVLPELIPVIVTYFPVGISVKTLEHYAQIARTGRFQRFDYGAMRNLLRYNSTTPPDYDMSAIAIPVYLFVGRADSIAAETDADLLRSKLKSIPHSEKFTYNYAHNDFFFGKHIKRFYRNLMDVMRQLGNSENS